MAVPGSLFFAGALGATLLVSLCTPPPACAQQWLPWRGSLPLPRTADPATVSPPGSLQTKPLPPQERHAPHLTREEPAGARNTKPSATVAPALTHSAVAIEPLPSSPVSSPVPMLMDVAALVSGPSGVATVAHAPLALVQIPACDEPGHCERLEAVHSGVGGRSKALKDEAAKRQPENDAKRHMLQSVRSVW